MFLRATNVLDRRSPPVRLSSYSRSRRRVLTDRGVLVAWLVFAGAVAFAALPVALWIRSLA